MFAQDKKLFDHPSAEPLDGARYVKWVRDIDRVYRPSFPWSQAVIVNSNSLRVEQLKKAEQITVNLEDKYMRSDVECRNLCLRLGLIAKEHSLSKVVSLVVKGHVNTCLIQVLIGACPSLRMVDLSRAYPCSSRLISMVTTGCRQLHELHFNLMPHGAFECRPCQIIRTLCNDLDSTIEHLEIHNFDHAKLDTTCVHRLYQLPNLKRLALHGFTDRKFALVKNGFGLAETWDAEAQEYNTGRSFTRRPHEGNDALLKHTLYVTRQTQAMHPPLLVEPGLVGKALAALNTGNRQHVSNRWGYVNHTLSLTQALSRCLGL